jgi:hypothetical protein
MRLFWKKTGQLGEPNNQGLIQKASGTILKLFEEIGLTEDLFRQITVSSTKEGKLLLTVEINAPALEEIFFLRGGKICAILQGFVPKLPTEIDGQKVEYLFAPLQEKPKPEIKTAGIDTGILGQAINNVGNWAIEHNVPELVTSFMIANHIWEGMKERERQHEEQLAGFPIMKL